MINIHFLSGGYKPWHADERGGASRFPLPRHDTCQQFPAAVCGGCPVERGEGSAVLYLNSDLKIRTPKDSFRDF